MEDALLAIELFVVFFSTACCLVSNRSERATTNNSSIEIKNSALQLATNTNNTAFVPKEESIISQPNELHTIEIERLKLREARKICKEINIQQKVNGKDVPLSWMKVQICEAMSRQSTELSALTEVLSTINLKQISTPNVRDRAS